MREKLTLTLTLFFITAMTVTPTYAGPCNATETSVNLLADGTCPIIHKYQQWHISWDHGFSEYKENEGWGQCRTYEPVENTPPGAKCWPQFYQPSLEAWSGNGYYYGRWSQEVYDGAYASVTSSCAAVAPARVARTPVRSCGQVNSGGGGGRGGGVEECDYASQLCGGGLGGNPSADLPPNCCEASPILIDVRGDGFALTPPSDGVRFDFNGDGLRGGPFSWTAPHSDDAWLALDRDGNGRVDHAGELFGNFTAQPPSSAPHGFHALALFDTAERGGNADGVIDRRDAVFADLRLWQDANGDAVCEPGELHPLRDLGLKSIELDYRESRRVDEHGNAFKYRARVRDVRGAHLGRWAWDVFLVSGQ